MTTESFLTPKQTAILTEIGDWAEGYSCLAKVHVFGSIARADDTAKSDLDIAFEYVPDIGEGHANTACYTRVNADWESLAEALGREFGHQPRCTGLSFADPYDVEAWRAIRSGHEVGRCAKAVMTWTAPKPKGSEDH
jgi:predicted nucleotidyltransferase